MKQAILHFDKGDVLLLEVNGEGLIRVEGGIISNLLVLEETWRIFQGDRYLCRCPFKPELIGKLSELTGDQFESIVPVYASEYYKNYNPSSEYEVLKRTAIESFLSKLEADRIAYDPEKTFVFRIFT